MILNKIETRKRKKIIKEIQEQQSFSCRKEGVAKKAFELFVKRGYVPGHDQEDWFEAEKLVQMDNR